MNKENHLFYISKADISKSRCSANHKRMMLEILTNAPEDILYRKNIPFLYIIQSGIFTYSLELLYKFAEIKKLNFCILDLITRFIKVNQHHYTDDLLLEKSNLTLDLIANKGNLQEMKKFWELEKRSNLTFSKEGALSILFLRLITALGQFKHRNTYYSLLDCLHHYLIVLFPEDRSQHIVQIFIDMCQENEL